MSVFHLNPKTTHFQIYAPPDTNASDTGAPTMPHAVEQDDDDAIITRILNEEAVEGLNIWNEHELDAGEKADDAKDFGDIDDDDLAEDEGVIEAPTSGNKQTQDLFEADEPEDGQDDPFDDLFGPDQPSSPLPEVKVEDPSFDDRASTQENVDSPDLGENDYEEEDEETKVQRSLFEQARRDREERLRRGENNAEPPPAPITNAEVFSIIYPQFEADKPPRFGELLPGKLARYVPKAPIKPPKPVHPTKVNLDIQQDQEKSFRLADQTILSFAARRAEAEDKGFVLLVDGERAQELSDEEADIEVLNETEEIGGIKWQDLVALCEDWDIPVDAPSPEQCLEELDGEVDEYDGLFGNNGEDNGPPAKVSNRASIPRLILITLIRNEKWLMDMPMHHLYSTISTFLSTLLRRQPQS